jgi:hypothetical protein
MWGVGFLAHLVLLFGYRSRLSAGVLWLIWSALEDRNPWLWNTGNILVPITLLLALLLPLEAGWGADYALAKRKPADRIVTVSLLPVLVLVFFAYFVNSIVKSHDSYIVGEMGLIGAVESHHGTPLGLWFVHAFPTLSRGLSVATIVLQAAGPLLLLVPLWPLRALAVGAFIVFHIATKLLLDVGDFAPVMISLLLLLVPYELSAAASRVGIKISRSFRKWFRLSPEPKEVAVFYDGGCGFCQRISHFLPGLLLVRARVSPAEGEIYEEMLSRRSWVVERAEGRGYEGGGFRLLLEESPLFFPLALLWRIPGVPWVIGRLYRLVADRRPGPAGAQALFPSVQIRPNTPLRVGVSLILSAAWLAFFLGQVENRYDQPYFRALASTLNAFGLEVYWGHFAPAPPFEYYWVSARGVTLEGEVVDLWRYVISDGRTAAPLEPRNPLEVFALQGNEHWRKLYSAAAFKEWAAPYLKGQIPKTLCEMWNQAHRDTLRQVGSVSLSLYWQSPDREWKPGKRLLGVERCDFLYSAAGTGSAQRNTSSP